MRPVLATILTLMMAAIPPMVFAAPTVEERLNKMQQEIDAARAENLELRRKVDQLEKERTADKALGLEPAGPRGATMAEFRANAASIQEPSPSPFVVRTGKETTLRLGGLLQGQGEFGDVDAWTGRFPGGSAGNRGDDRFRVRRARITVTGDFLEQFDFKVDGGFDLSDGSANQQSTFAATDIYANWHQFPEFQIKVGQFKTPFGREWNVANATLFSAEYSLVTQSLSADRQIGVQLWGYPLQNVLDDPHEQLIEYRLGAFNGNGRNRSFNDNESFMYAGRLQLNAFQPYSFLYGDTDNDKTNRNARFSVGVNGLVEDHANRKTPLTFRRDGGVLASGPDALGDGSLSNTFAFGSDYRRAAWGADIAARWGPFDFTAEYLQERFDPAQTTATDKEFKASGWYAMGAYFLPVPNMPHKFQWFEKFDYYDPSSLLGHDTIRTLHSGLNWYVKGDDIRVLLEWMRTWSEARRFLSRDDEFDLLLLRLQLMF